MRLRTQRKNYAQLMKIIEEIGNRDLMNREKTLFICSKLTPIKLYEHIFRWTDSLTDNDCIACFNSTEMEAEVLKALLVAKIPTVLFVINRFTDVNNYQISKARKENRILIVVLKRDEPRGKGATPRLRNEYVLSICQHIVCGYTNKNGSVFSLLAGRENITNIISENDHTLVAEQHNRHERWTVAQDKVLLRMFYADMGIHAIHKQLKRSYTAVYTRIRSITQPEEVLKGREFEDYVLSLFNIEEDDKLILQEWQGDKSLGKIKPENNSYPDFVFRYGKKKFAIECKWRERLSTSFRKDLFTTKSLENYKHFSENKKIPVTIILGIGGEPCAPNSIYIIPLEFAEDVKSGALSISKFLNKSRSLNISDFILPKRVTKSKSTEKKKP